ncbi:MAG: response regulator [Chitinivibrionales bacterium]|nr:response regulator [Chitinivibrionales bacterium]
MNIQSFFTSFAYGRRLARRLHENNLEYNRKATLLLTLSFAATVMLSVFAVITFIRGDFLQTSLNTVFLFCVLAGFWHLRRTGNLATASYLFIGLLCAKFIGDFGTDIYRAMWVYTIPLLVFFLLGTRQGIILSAICFIIVCGMMVFAPRHAYPVDFMIRFPAIYFCCVLYAFSFESVRNRTHAKLEHSRSNLIAANEELRKLSSRNDAILGAVPDIIMEVNTAQVYTWANKAGYEFFGNDVIGKEAGYYFEGEQDTRDKVAPLFAGTVDLMYTESQQRRRDGENRLLAWWCRTLRDGAGAVIGALSSARDITEINKLEQQLRQAQKMDAVGQLAGGIAHDFNNQLSAISGFAELIQAKATDPTISRFAEKILLSAKRSADLTAQLLAFSRKGKVMSVAADIQKVLLEVVDILSHTINKNIVITQRFNASEATILCDPSQVQNAFLNLALNARDAMPDGGELIFETELMDLDRKYCKNKHYEIQAGRYLRISVTDSGTGMDAETKKHVFEPFFTTKEMGKGTGMGLAAVYGIVKSHKGAIDVYSEPGHGTTFRLYFPVLNTVAKEQSPVAPPSAVGKSLHVLFIDDEESVREMAAEMLRSFGHRVTVRENGKEGLVFYRKSWQSIDCVILDMIMPEMNGKDAFLAMREINPRIRAILSSGYSINGEAQEILDAGVLGFVQKPFRFDQIKSKIEEAMKKDF